MKIFAILIALVISAGTAIYAFFRSRKDPVSAPANNTNREDKETKDALEKIDKEHEAKIKETEDTDTSTVSGGTDLLRDYIEARDRAAKPSSGN